MSESRFPERAFIPSFPGRKRKRSSSPGLSTQPLLASHTLNVTVASLGDGASLFCTRIPGISLQILCRVARQRPCEPEFALRRSIRVIPLPFGGNLAKCLALVRPLACLRPAVSDCHRLAAFSSAAALPARC